MAFHSVAPGDPGTIGSGNLLLGCPALSARPGRLKDLSPFAAVAGILQ